jgi:flavorubredoxin
MQTKKITEDFTWVGTLDPDLRMFDIVVKTDHGTTYNSYVLKAKEGNVLFEASKAQFFDDYVKTVEEVCPIKDIKYLVVNHTEPDHTGTIAGLLDINPDMEIVSSMGGNNFIKEIVNKPFNGQIVKDGEEIPLGDKTLKFIMAPNLHWPDTMFTYIQEENILVTCDAFGGHYCEEGITDDNIKDKDEYYEAVKFYFESIVEPFKPDVLRAYEKIKGLDIDIIANGHGPVIIDCVEPIINLYKELATEVNPNTKKTVIIPYVSAYGYTEMIGESIRDGIMSVGDIDVRMYNMVDANFDDVMNEIYYSDGFLLGTPTMVGEALEPMWKIVSHMTAKMYGGKVASAFGSYGWSGEGVPHIMGRLSQLKLKIYEEGLRFRFKPSEIQLEEAQLFGKGFGEAVLKGDV